MQWSNISVFMPNVLIHDINGIKTLFIELYKIKIKDY